MDDTLLNRAHRAGQKALTATLQGDLTSGIALHLEAAQHLKNLQAQLPQSNGLRNSLNYFIQDYERQARLTETLRNRKEALRNSENQTQPNTNSKSKNPISTGASGSSGNGKAMMNENTATIAGAGGGASSTGTGTHPRKHPPTPGTPHNHNHSKSKPPKMDLEQYDSLLPIHLRSAIPGSGSGPNFTLRPRNTSELAEEQELVITNLRILIESQASTITQLQNELKEQREKEDAYLQEIQQLKKQLAIAKNN